MCFGKKKKQGKRKISITDDESLNTSTEKNERVDEINIKPAAEDDAIFSFSDVSTQISYHPDCPHSGIDSCGRKKEA